MNVQNNFQLKIPTLRKMTAASSGGQIKFKKDLLEANSGMFIGTKNITVFCSDFFYSFWLVRANSGLEVQTDIKFEIVKYVESPF